MGCLGRSPRTLLRRSLDFFARIVAVDDKKYLKKIGLLKIASISHGGFSYPTSLRAVSVVALASTHPFLSALSKVVDATKAVIFILPGYHQARRNKSTPGYCVMQ